MGMMVINPDGVAVRTTMDSTHTNTYSAILSRLTDQVPEQNKQHEVPKR